MTWPFSDMPPLSYDIIVADPVASLRRLASDPSAALEIGKAAEHMVCADLILSGYRAFLSDQGLPYDICVDIGGRIIRVQVKACCFPKNVNSAGRIGRLAYGWNIRRRGKGAKGERLDERHCDVVACVALDTKIVAYLPIEVCGQTLQLSPPGSVLKTKFRSGAQWARNIDQFPFAEAISGGAERYKASLRRLEHCVHGHAYTPENTRINKAGARTCRECSRLHSAKSYSKRKQGAADV